MADEANEVTEFLKAPNDKKDAKRELPTSDTQCGFGIFKGPRIQRYFHKENISLSSFHVILIIAGPRSTCLWCCSASPAAL